MCCSHVAVALVRRGGGSCDPLGTDDLVKKVTRHHAVEFGVYETGDVVEGAVPGVSVQGRDQRVGLEPADIGLGAVLAGNLETVPLNHTELRSPLQFWVHHG
jgi:hypothetical protein